MKNLQCPVCTLYLHEGINLCDHLETHPKEQVIQALVQMTISNNEHRSPLPPPSRSSLIEINHTESGNDDVESKLLIQSNVLHKETVKQTSTNRLTPFNKDNDLSNSSNSSHSVSIISTVSNQSSTNTKTSICDGISFGENNAIDNSSSFSSNSQKVNGSGLKSFTSLKDPNRLHDLTNATQSYSTSQPLNVLSNTPTDFTIIHSQRYQQHQQIPQTSTDLFRNNLNAIAGVPVTNSQTVLQASTTIPNEMTTLNLPPPMHTNTHRQSIAYQSQSNTHHQQQHHHTLHLQQNLLHQQIYSAELSPPTPLQLFSYQSTIPPQHQKPPPAYGTAISQIRSQSKNQQKYQQYGTLQSQGQMSSSVMPFNIKQQQQPQHVLQRSTLQSQIQQTQPSPTLSINAISNQLNVSNTKTLGVCKTELNKNSCSLAPRPPPFPSTSMQNKTNLNLNTQSTDNINNDTLLKNCRNLSNTLGGAVSSPTLASTSTTSVLRYAESPVAHYLERDNGDFIVQETPKHIMEYVEKDDGEFSVIERIYQSPPSILHIHDDDEDDNDDNVAPASISNDNDNTNKANCNNVNEKDESQALSSQMPLTKITNSSTEAQNYSDIEDDFMSASGESDQEFMLEDAEEIQEKRKSLTNKDKINAETESNKINEVDTDKARINSRTPLATAKGTSASAASSTPTVNSLIQTSATTTTTATAVTPSTTITTTVTSISMSPVTTTTVRKKSSKNTITVLSDVQLNLNEYLDLVGNIIASSRTSAQRKPTVAVSTATAITAGTTTIGGTLPLVKVEKEEPPDDEYESHKTQTDLKNQHNVNTKLNNVQVPQHHHCLHEKDQQQKATEKQMFNESQINNKYETDDGVVVNDVSNKISNNVNEKVVHSQDNKEDLNDIVEEKPDVNEHQNNVETIGGPLINQLSGNNYSDHATISVIRMASTSKQLIDLEQSKPVTENLGAINTGNCERNTDDSRLLNQVEGFSKIEMNMKQHKESTAAKTDNACSTMSNDPDYTAKQYFKPSVARKGPKKLIIKPKPTSSTTKTDQVMPNNNNDNNKNTNINDNINNNNNNSQNADSNKFVRYSYDQKPSTSAKAKEEFCKLKQQTKKTASTPKNKENKGKGIKNGKAALQKEIDNFDLTTTMELINESNKFTKTSEKSLQKKCGQQLEHCEEVKQDVEDMPEEKIQVKSEPLSLVNYESPNDFNNVLLHEENEQEEEYQEQHDGSTVEDIIMICKEEKPCFVEATLPMDMIVTPVKSETNINDDARVLYNFANSRKNSVNDVTATATTARALTSNDPVVTTCRNVNDEHNVITTPSSTTTTLVANDNDVQRYDGTNLTHNIVSIGNANADGTQSSPVQNLIDYPFSFLYNNNQLPQPVDIKCPQTLYQNISGPSSSFSPSPNVFNIMMNVDDGMKKENDNKTNLESTEWFHNADPSTSSTSAIAPSNNNNNSNHVGIDFNSSLSADCNATNLDDGSDVGKYLDLDACKRERKFDLAEYHQQQQLHGSSADLPLSSSNSCSLTGNMDNSLVSGGNSLVSGGGASCSAPLNIRTDEKMPAKGEISEQESNCDIDNSWSQPMYGDISARFFKTSFPSMFTHDSGWHHDDCFSVQDLSASTTTTTTQAQGTASISGGSNNRTRSFDLRLSLETNDNYINGGSQQMFSLNNQSDNADNNNIMPSTSTKSRKRRKRSGQDDKVMTQLQQQKRDRTLDINELEHVPPVSNTIMSEFMPDTNSLTNIGNVVGSTFASPSTTITTSASITLQQPQQRQQQQQQHKAREKTYECTICYAKYAKLKDRNAHMVDVHKYVRQNRKLVCPQTMITSTVVSSDANANTSAVTAGNVAPSTTVACSIISQPNNISSIGGDDDLMEDSKHGIIKMEHNAPLQTLPTLDNAETNFISKDSKDIEVDDKRNLTLLSSTENAMNVQQDEKAEITEQGEQKEVKYSGALKRLGFSVPTTKLTNLYRMLVNYNMSNLKMKQDLSEIDEELMQSLVFYCHLCQRSFPSVKLYDIHLTEHPAECFSCGKTFQRWKNLSLHLKRHMGLKEFGCNVCDKKFVVRSALVEHMRMHSGHSPLKCKICGKHFKRYSNLTQHRKRHTKQLPRKKEYVCFCGEVLPSKARFLWHKEIHDSKPKCCNYCCDRFIHINSLKRHIRLAHSDKFNYVEPMECPICKQVFAKASMKSHMATHSTDNQYDCTICNKTFSTKWNLKIHSWVHANRTAKPYKCDNCPKAFVREIDYKNHINSHKQIRPYTCEVCGCKFIRKYNYMRHRREHHGDKKFTCDLCKKSFHRHYYLIEHRRIHTGERPFQCTICGKSSTTKTNHNKHMKIHHSRDPFTVEV